MPVVGILHSASREPIAKFMDAFRLGLSEGGFAEGQNAAIEYRWAEGQFDRLPAFAADLVRRQVTVIVAMGMPAPVAAKAATQTIPIVFTIASDPVTLGLVSNLSRPGGNLTGATALSVELGPKQLEFLHELLPKAKTVALLLNPSNPIVSENLAIPVTAAARALGLELHSVHASNDREIEVTIARLAQEKIDGLVIGADPYFNSRSAQFATLAARHGIPTASFTREFAISGGLMSYVGSFSDLYRLAGTYAGRILKGEKPADLPVVQATKVELIVNLKAAKALGLDVPPTLLARADEVIE
jgi:putative ABC transport system substrate-binding protein